MIYESIRVHQVRTEFKNKRNQNRWCRVSFQSLKRLLWNAKWGGKPEKSRKSRRKTMWKYKLLADWVGFKSICSWRTTLKTDGVFRIYYSGLIVENQPICEKFGMREFYGVAKMKITDLRYRTEFSKMLLKNGWYSVHSLKLKVRFPMSQLDPLWCLC